VFGGRLNWLKAGWANRAVTPLVCRQTVAEMIRILSYAKFRLSLDEQKSLLSLYLPYAKIMALADPLAALPVNCRDANDDIFLHLAIAGGADVLVTGDADLLALRGSAPVRIVTVRDLREMLGT
jgi:putative PIN family toxin of toxin-antitoxin system